MSIYRLVTMIFFGLLLVTRAQDLIAQCSPNEVLVGKDVDNYYCEDKDKPNIPTEFNVLLEPSNLHICIDDNCDSNSPKYSPTPSTVIKEAFVIAVCAHKGDPTTGRALY